MVKATVPHFQGVTRALDSSHLWITVNWAGPLPCLNSNSGTGLGLAVSTSDGYTAGGGGRGQDGRQSLSTPTAQENWMCDAT